MFSNNGWLNQVEGEPSRMSIHTHFLSMVTHSQRGRYHASTCPPDQSRIQNKLTAAAILAATALTPGVQAYVGSTTPKLHVSGRFLQDTSNKNVLLHGWMQPTETWFNGEGNRYSNPTDWNNTANVAGMLN